MTLTKITKFLISQKINWRFGATNNCLMQGLAKIDNGCFVIDKSLENKDIDNNSFSLILHELSHFLSVPKSQRDCLTHNLKGVDKVYISEFASRLVTLDLCNILDIDKELAISFFASGNTEDRKHSVITFQLQALCQFDRERYYNKSKAVTYLC